MHLVCVLLQRYSTQTNGWWLPYFEALMRYYTCKLNKDSSKLKVRSCPQCNNGLCWPEHRLALQVHKSQQCLSFRRM